LRCFSVEACLRSSHAFAGAAFQPRFSRHSQSCFGEVDSSRLKKPLPHLVTDKMRCPPYSKFNFSKR
jgi:hypothetical protein